MRCEAEEGAGGEYDDVRHTRRRSGQPREDELELGRYTTVTLQ